ncbi:1,4-dihydroxy-6-naphthoate synthase [Virgisporangium aurantiacum]|uniref:1,4-dihydroxy-6-naphtoate synthase n=1 Tax=Virgisporangium aurantiacum TaxID=175570 RepID=A0A8J3Z9A4_9ACTN|nr:1,4-dihydroxy-6-naphtoate synthase [Virgisporangium aurantiacum]
MNLTISPCPNDTFTFHALAHGLVPGAPTVEVRYADVDVTNTLAVTDDLDLVKVSYAALPWLLDRYELLPCGGALGRGCGPLLLARSALRSIDGLRVAVPGDRTTAYLLMRLWMGSASPASIEVVPFASIMPGVADGTYDAGLVIHEARFVYPRFGLTSVVDLGEWWESTTGLPIPLGAILARRGAVDAAAATGWIRESVRRAWADPSLSREYVLAHAQEMEQDVVDQHIKLYVNEFTHDLGDEGYGAVRGLLNRAADAGLVPAASDL